MAFTSVAKPSTSFSSVSKPTTSWSAGSKPTTTYGQIIDVAQNYLLINTVDFLLTNSSGDRLLINGTRDGGYSAVSSQSAPTYTTIAKPA